MTDQEITALAREYGEYAANNPIVAPYFDTDEKKGLHIRANANRAKDVIKWMADRFCLVEKSEVKHMLETAMKNLSNELERLAHDRWELNQRNRQILNIQVAIGVLNHVFPEIAKEVER